MEKQQESEPGAKAGLFEGADVIASYSCADAIADGILVDVSEMARECGMLHLAAVTERVWSEVIEPSESARKEGQS